MSPIKTTLLCINLCLILPLAASGQSWADELESDENGIAQSSQFGAVYTAGAPWYYFAEWSSWFYGEAASIDTLWLYKPDQPAGWYWSSIFPTVYYQPDNDWLYVEGGYAYNFTDQKWRLASAPSRVVVRKEISQLTDAEIAAFVDTLIAMKNTPSAYFEEVNAYDYFVMLHNAAFMCVQEKACPHRTAMFLPWHREMLRRFELELQRVSGDPTMTLPYWDWTNPDSYNRIFSEDFLGDDGSLDPDQASVVQTSRFGEQAGIWRKAFVDFTDDEHDGVTGDSPTPDEIYLTRGVGIDPGSALPTAAEVAAAYEFELYDEEGCNEDTFAGPPTFRRYVEAGERPDGPGMHDVVHVYIGGDMATGTSPNDPVFFLHHCNVDRIWAVWQDLHGRDQFPESCADEEFYAFDDVTARDQFDFRAIGFRYTDPTK